ncbi:ABC transporter substrate-binding protein [Jeongeupia chitinilytica]|uniref:Iron ABC transporter substrate-binding protein n=1 Tax=Jeongeupia chitinilytica TaxID=1041641 RepID=A0ABQ3GYW9_9NEIS|nr:ABC transporter substrate-binding protein [Jeongeupia chitinilytica]GHD56853.1 iron ABC transporter substrate-binding protein [Jeongeupia chitinilytica]
MIQRWLKYTGLALAGAMVLLAGPVRAVTVTDLAGRKVELPKKVDRILLGEGRLFYSLALLEGDRPVARIAGWQGDFRQLDPQTYGQYRAKFPEIDRIPLIGKTSEATVSGEKVVSLKPDIAVFSLAGHGPSVHNPLVRQLEAAKIPVIFVDFRLKPLENAVPSLRLMGKALQREAQAEKFIRFYEQNMKLVTDTVKGIPSSQRPKVFLDLRAGTMEGIATAGNGNIGEMIDAAGGINIGSGLLSTEIGEVNLEKVIATNPAAYIATGAGAPDARLGLKLGQDVSPAMARASLDVVATRAQLGALGAVRNGKTYGAWHHFYTTPYHVVLVQQLAKWLQPAAFAKLDPQATWSTMYKEFLAVQPQGTFWVEGGGSR